MKKSILILITVVLVLMAAGCSIDPTASDALADTVWTNKIPFIAGSRLTFNADGTGVADQMLLGEWTEEGDAFTYTYDASTKSGIITGSLFIVLNDGFTGDSTEFTVSAAGNSISFRGWDFSFGF